MFDWLVSFWTCDWHVLLSKKVLSVASPPPLPFWPLSNKLFFFSRFLSYFLRMYVWPIERISAVLYVHAQCSFCPTITLVSILFSRNVVMNLIRSNLISFHLQETLLSCPDYPGVCPIFPPPLFLGGHLPIEFSKYHYHVLNGVLVSIPPFPPAPWNAHIFYPRTPVNFILAASGRRGNFLSSIAKYTS